MDKYLFNDGTNGVREAHTREELLSLINSTPEPAKARIWIFSTNEWISLPAFLALQPGIAGKEAVLLPTNAAALTTRPPRRKAWLRTPLFVLAAAAGTLLIFNFTSAKWEKAAPLKSSAARPANVPVLQLDSLVTEIEMLRGKMLDKSTRHNLRLRNNWPEHILLQLQAEKETKGKNNRFFSISVSIDNATGSLLEKAQVRLETWKNGKATLADTLQFSNIRYDKVLQRQLTGSYRCDSISVSFLSIQAKAFNFCYSATAKNNSGNYNDRWFCPQGKPAEQ